MARPRLAGSAAGRPYVISGAQTAAKGSALVVVLCAEGERAESAIAANALADLRRDRGATYAVFEGRGSEKCWAGYGRRSGARGDAEEVRSLLLAERLLEDCGDAALPGAASGGPVVVCASSTAVRTALQLGHLVSAVDLYLLHNPLFLGCCDSREDEALDAQPSLAKSKVFIFGGPEGDKLLAGSLPAGPLCPSLSLYVILWLLDTSDNCSLRAWSPKGNAELAMTVSGTNLVARSSNCFLVVALDHDVVWFHAAAHVLDAFVAHRMQPKMWVADGQRYGEQGHGGYGENAEDGKIAAMLSSLEEAFTEVRDAAGGYPSRA